MSDTADIFDGPSFTTASARGLRELIRFRVEGRVYNEQDDTIEDVDEVLTLDPRTSIIGFGKVFGAFISLVRANNEMEADSAKLRQQLAAAKGGDAVNAVDIEALGRQLAMVEKLEEAMEPAKAGLRKMLVPPSRVKFDRVKDALDVETLTQILVMLTGRLSPMDFTERPSSLDGSPETGEPSAPGAPSTAPMPPPSL